MPAPERQRRPGGGGAAQVAKGSENASHTSTARPPTQPAPPARLRNPHRHPAVERLVARYNRLPLDDSHAAQRLEILVAIAEARAPRWGRRA